MFITVFRAFPIVIMQGFEDVLGFVGMVGTQKLGVQRQGWFCSCSLVVPFSRVILLLKTIFILLNDDTKGINISETEKSLKFLKSSVRCDLLGHANPKKWFHSSQIHIK